jgi:DNA-binding NarL/FixJ family response regulator
MSVRIVLADDHPLLRAGVRAVLACEPQFEVVGEEVDGASALQTIVEQRPEVAVLDIEMANLTGIEVARKLNDRAVPTAVVVLSMHPDESFVRAAIDAGVSGYVLKQDAAKDLVHAIQSAARGEVFISPRVAGALVDYLRKGKSGAPQLSPRERDVVRLISRGFSSKEIAADLGLTPKTVEGYRSAIMDKLNIHSVAGLVKYAIRQHLAAVED